MNKFNLTLENIVEIVNEIISHDVKFLKRKILLYNFFNNTRYLLEDLYIDVIGESIYVCNILYNKGDILDYKYFNRAINKYKRAYKWIELKTHINSDELICVNDIEEKIINLNYDDETLIKIGYSKKLPNYFLNSDITELFLNSFFYTIHESNLLCKKVLKDLTKDKIDEWINKKG